VRTRRAEVQRRGRRRGRFGSRSGRPADDLRQRPQGRHPRLGRPLPWPAHPQHQAARQRLQGDALGRGLLARRPGQPTAAAGLRHGLADQGRPHGIPRPARRGREARPPQARRRARPLLLPRRARLGLPVFHPKGGVIKREMEDYVAAGTSRRASSTSARRTSPRRGSSTPPGTCPTTRTRCSRRWRWRAATTTSRR
jgi:hypothetical protein